MKDIKLMIDFIQEMSSAIYEKDVYFYDYDKDMWYSRMDCEYVYLEAVLEDLRNELYPCISHYNEWIS